MPCCPFLPLCSDIRDTYITLRVFPEGQQCNWMRPSSNLKADQLIDGAECKTTRTCPVLLPFFATCEPRPAVSTRPRFARNHFFYASRVRVPAPGENANYFPWLVRDSRARRAPSTSEKIAELTPIVTASVPIATALNPRDFASNRREASNCRTCEQAGRCMRGCQRRSTTRSRQR